MGDSDALQIGQTVIAIGNSLAQYQNTVTKGVVSGLARNITAGGGGTSERLEDVIQTDAAINPRKFRRAFGEFGRASGGGEIRPLIRKANWSDFPYRSIPLNR